MIQKPWYSVEEIAAVLSVNVQTIRRYIKAGKLKAVKIGKAYRIPAESFDELMKID